MTSAAPATRSPGQKPPSDVKAPILWAAMDSLSWVRLLARQRFAVHPARWRAAAIASFSSVFSTALSFLQEAFYGSQIAATQVRHAPLFVIGHWRTGTTHLHELLSCDPRHAFPNTHDCFSPAHFLLSRHWAPRLFAWAMPERRPMDQMRIGFERPQEDEFALLLLGEPSPYECIAFPASGEAPLLLEELRAFERRRWAAVFRRLIQALTLAHGNRRLVLKSPTHSFRIPTLLRLFPDARFVHIVRDPYVVYASTLHLWRTVYTLHGLQPPAWEELPGRILQGFRRLHECLDDHRRLIGPQRFHEVRYEDLIRDPLESLEGTYQALDLGSFAPARPRVEAYLKSVKDYETNRHLLTAEEERMITREWGPIIQRYGYPLRS